MDPDNQPTFGLGTLPNLDHAIAKQAAMDPSGWVNSPQGAFSMGTDQNTGESTLTPLPQGGSFAYAPDQSATYMQPQQAQMAPMPQMQQQPMQPPQQMQGMQAQAQTPNQPMSFADYQSQMFGQPQGSPGQMNPYQSMMQMQQQHMQTQQRRGMAQRLGVVMAGMLGGPAAAAAAAQTIQGHNANRAALDGARMQAQMEMMKFAADNDPNSFKNKMSAMTNYQTYMNQFGDNKRADATLDETKRHDMAGETQARTDSDNKATELQNQNNHNSFQDYLGKLGFDQKTKTDAQTALHQNNMDAHQMNMDTHTIAHDVTTDKRADGQLAVAQGQLKNSDRTYKLQADKQSADKAKDAAEMIAIKGDDGNMHLVNKYQFNPPKVEDKKNVARANPLQPAIDWINSHMQPQQPAAAQQAAPAKRKPTREEVAAYLRTKNTASKD